MASLVVTQITIIGIFTSQKNLNMKGSLNEVIDLYAVTISVIIC